MNRIIIAVLQPKRSGLVDLAFGSFFGLLRGYIVFVLLIFFIDNNLAFGSLEILSASSSLHNIDVANYSNAAAGGLDRTGGITGSRMRWIAYKRTYSANNNVFKNSDLVINNGTLSRDIVNPSPFVWGTHYEAYVYVPSIGKYANLRDSGGTTGAGDIYSSTSISAANDYTGGGALQRPDGIATGAAYIVPHTSPGSTDIYFIIGLKVDSNLYITHIPTTQYTS